MGAQPFKPFGPPPADPNEALEPYEPGPGRPWDRRHAAHLLRRGGFGGPLAEVDAAVELGPAGAARALVGAPADPGTVELDRVLDAVLEEGSADALRAWWCLRMVRTAAPFREKLALFLHGHFATGLRKVGSAVAMREQAAAFLEAGGGPFRELAKRVITGAAILVYLDGARSERRRPNENLARELMELFTLGRGNYSEGDVREAARALTGWRVDRRGAHFHEPAFDGGEKRVLGKVGNLGAGETVDACLDHPGCAPFLARKLLVFYVTPEPPEAWVAALANTLRELDFALAPALERLLASNAFHSDASYRAGVKSPAEYAVGALRALGGRVSGNELARSLGEMGQTLFDPPSVKGWDGGRTWIHSATWLARARFAHAATSSGGPLERDFEPAGFLASVNAKDPRAAADFALDALLQGDVPAAARESLVSRLRESGGGAPAQRALVQAALLLPEYHCS